MLATIGVELIEMTCWCGIVHAVPKNLHDLQHREFHEGKAPKAIYCPVGHTHVPAGIPRYKVAEQALARERAAHDQTRAQCRDAELQMTAAKGTVTRLRHRVAKGVCPCCKRSFLNLARHMHSKHPKFGN
jgi:hypothetical protein